MSMVSLINLFKLFSSVSYFIRIPKYISVSVREDGNCSIRTPSVLNVRVVDGRTPSRVSRRYFSASLDGVDMAYGGRGCSPLLLWAVGIYLNR